MTNVAILVGISQTNAPDFCALPCCGRDVDAMADLLRSCQKYDSIEILKDATADGLRDKLRQILAAPGDIEEFFFYFSGHGYRDDSDDNGFYFVMNRFVTAQKSTTGVARDDLLNHIRELKPQLTVLVIDACYSGLPLIKSGSHPLANQAIIKSIYQFAACTPDQEALGGENLSPFTNNFIEATTAKTEGTIYYADILPALRDIYELNRAQSPHFIGQGGLRDVFCDDAAKLSRVRQTYTAPAHMESAPASTMPACIAPHSPKDIIATFERAVPTEREAQTFIDNFATAFDTHLRATSRTGDFFDFRVAEHNNFYEIEERAAIVNRLASGSRFDNWVTAERRQVKKRQMMPWHTLDLLYPQEYETVFVLTNNSELQRVHRRFFAEPKFVTLERGCAELVFVPSVQNCSIFYQLVFHPRLGWKKFEDHAPNAGWMVSVQPWGVDATGLARELADRYVAKLEAYVGEIAQALSK